MENSSELNTIDIKSREWWHFRKYYKSGHAALIVGEDNLGEDGYYVFLNVTKNPPTGYAYYETNRPISINEEKKSNIRLYLQKGKKKRFSKWKMKYELTDKDYSAIEEFFKQQKEKALKRLLA